jgi:hypothetical protein
MNPQYLELDALAAKYMRQGMDENAAYELAYREIEQDELDEDQNEIH